MNKDLYHNSVVISYDDTNQNTLSRNKLTTRNITASDLDYHTVVEGDTLDQLSYINYGSNRYWWVIADINDIGDTLINPFEDLQPGQRLLIPALDQITGNR